MDEGTIELGGWNTTSPRPSRKSCRPACLHGCRSAWRTPVTPEHEAVPPQALSAQERRGVASPREKVLILKPSSLGGRLSRRLPVLRSSNNNFPSEIYCGLTRSWPRCSRGIRISPGLVYFHRDAGRARRRALARNRVTSIRWMRQAGV